MRRMLVAFAVVSLSLPAFAKSDNDRAGVGDNITIEEGQTAGDVACAFCSVHVHGEVKGDVAVLFGDITVDAGKSIGGDVAALGGNLNLGAGSWVGGDVAIAAGQIQASDGAAIHGSRAVAPSKIWVLLPFVPLLALAGLIWLIVWLVQRNRYQFPAYPQGRRP
jgi:hypothetical protein